MQRPQSARNFKKITDLAHKAFVITAVVVTGLGLVGIGVSTVNYFFVEKPAKARQKALEQRREELE